MTQQTRKLRHIGKRIPRVDASDKVMGVSAYGADVHFKGSYFIKGLRSPHPHAHIHSIRYEEASKLSGVSRVITWQDIPGVNLCGKLKQDQPFLAEKKVRYVGELIAAVVAKTEKIAEHAVNRIAVDYEPLKPILSPEEALKPESPLINDATNLLKEVHLHRGDVSEGLSKSDVIIKNTYTTPFVEHAYIEPEAGSARIDGSGRVWIYAPTQFPHHVAKEICQMLAYPPEKVRVIQTTMGGGFGGKIDISVHGVLALAAFLTKKPVKWVYTREESMLSTAKRHLYTMKYITGATKEGKLMVADVDILMDGGAYASSGPAVASRAAIHAAGPYYVPHVRIRSRSAYTNNPIAGAMRGFGVPQVAFACESQMDLLAERLGIDPLRFREMNILKQGMKTITGQVLEGSVGLENTLKTAHQRFSKIRKLKNVKPYLRRGIGYSCMFYGIGNTGQINRAEVKLQLDHEGHIKILVGSAELGQGLLTVFQQIGAEALELPLEEVEVHTEDTFKTADPGVTSASKQTYLTGKAICNTAQKLLKEISHQLALQLKMSPEEITYSCGVFRLKKGGKKIKISLRQAANILSEKRKSLLETVGMTVAATTSLDPENSQGAPYPTYTYASQVAEVEVDVRTGKVRVLRIISAHDVGKAINPGTIESQIEGGVIMGIGYALMERFDPGRTKNLQDYLIPTSCDIPKIIPLIVEHPEKSGPYGAKGMGEAAAIPTAAAIANAVSHALGIRITHLPLTPERIYDAIKSKREN